MLPRPAVLLPYFLLAFLPAAFAALTLRPVSTIYLPYAYDNDGNGVYGIDEAAVEQTGYDTSNKLAYSAGNNFIHITDWSDATAPSVVYRTETNSTCNDIETCGDFVAFVLEGETTTDIGTLQVYALYDKNEDTWTKLFDVSVGSKPDMLHFSHDCQTIVVANEGEAAQNANEMEFINPEGSVSIVRLINSSATDIVYSVTHLNFSEFNDRADEFVERGVRYPYRGQLNNGSDTFAQNLEPEYITFNSNDTMAYIGLQENNAVAVIDLVNDNVVDIFPLGEKSWLTLELDASDKDDGILFRHSDIFSFYQPDGIKYFEEAGVGYIITANEGDSFEYELGSKDWAESQRGNDFLADDYAASVGADLIANVSDNDILGRLQFSTVDGLSESEPTKYEKLYFFGARGFSIFRADNLSLVYDSGDEVERTIAQYYPDVFNTNTKPDDADEDTPASFFDKRSDNLGPECESVELGEIDGRRVLFIGVDRTAAILIYSFPTGEVQPEFESVYRAGGRTETFQELLDARNLGDLDPEDLKFISASESATGRPMLMVTSTVSGTLSLYEVYDDEVTTAPPPEVTTDSEAPITVASCLVLMLSLLASLLVQM
ncbi:mesenchyme-specific cell surface glycoprotein-like [Diadema setosum]|uniref:mesenchyme-specific cell surface glycoprotein-like n=1 Tax=Diadema setosum TaxID=31175 RepID=UPI003B3B3A20